MKVWEVKEHIRFSVISFSVRMLTTNLLKTPNIVSVSAFKEVASLGQAVGSKSWCNPACQINIKELAWRAGQEEQLISCNLLIIRQRTRSNNLWLPQCLLGFGTNSHSVLLHFDVLFFFIWNNECLEHCVCRGAWH